MKYLREIVPLNEGWLLNTYRFLRGKKKPTTTEPQKSTPQNKSAHTKDNAPEKETTSAKDKAALTKKFVNWTHENNPQAFENIHKAIGTKKNQGDVDAAMKHMANSIGKFRDHHPEAWHHEEAMHVMGHVFKHRGKPPKQK
jgi:hypothetical protein